MENITSLPLIQKPVKDSDLLFHVNLQYYLDTNYTDIDCLLELSIKDSGAP